MQRAIPSTNYEVAIATEQMPKQRDIIKSESFGKLDPQQTDLDYLQVETCHAYDTDPGLPGCRGTGPGR